MDDVNDFEYSDSENYFKKSLKELFPNYWEKSCQNGISIYKSLRCGMIHSVRPGDRIWLRDKISASFPNLTIVDKKLHIIIDDLVDDYESAAIKIIKRIRTENFYQHSKFREPFIQY